MGALGVDGPARSPPADSGPGDDSAVSGAGPEARPAAGTAEPVAGPDGPDAPSAGNPWLEFALAKSVWPDDRAVALLLFNHLAEPQPVQRRSFALGSGARFDIGLRGETYWLREAWASITSSGTRCSA